MPDWGEGGPEKGHPRAVPLGFWGQVRYPRWPKPAPGRSLLLGSSPRPDHGKTACSFPTRPLLAAPPFSPVSLQRPVSATGWGLTAQTPTATGRNGRRQAATVARKFPYVLYSHRVVTSRVHASEQESVAQSPPPRPQDHPTEDNPPPPGSLGLLQGWAFLINKNSTLKIYIYI